MPESCSPNSPEDNKHPSLADETSDYLGTNEIPNELKARLYSPNPLPAVVGSDSSASQTEMQKLDRRVDASRNAENLPIAANYKLLRHIGQGTFGTVWEAVNQLTEEHVAIKFFLRGGVLESVIDETRMLGKLAGCTGIMGYKEVSWNASDPYYVMPLATGGSLAERIRQSRPDVKTTVRIFEQIVDAMAFVHSKGVIHCDLKPANILLSEDGKPLIADFGQSHLTTNSAPALGTFFYMAPEQATLEPTVPDTRWDVYALGAILHEMLTGEPPRASQKFREKLANLRTGNTVERLRYYRTEVGRQPLANLRKNNPAIDVPLAQLVQQCLDPDPARRPMDAGDIRELLVKRRRLLKNGPFIRGALQATVIGIIGMATLSYFASNRMINDSEAELRKEIHNSLTHTAHLGGQLLQEKIQDRMDFLKKSAVLMEAKPEVVDRLRAARAKYREALRNGLPDKFDAKTVLSAAERAKLGESIQGLDAEFRLTNHLADEPADHKSPDSLPLEGASQYSLLLNVDHRAYFAAICDDTGKLVADTPEFGRNQAWRDFFNGAEDKPDQQDLAVKPGLQPHISDMYFCKTSNQWVIDLSVPLFDKSRPPGDPDRFLGKLISSVHRDTDLSRWLVEYGSESDMDFVLVIRRDNRLQWNTLAGESVYLDEGRVNDPLVQALVQNLPNASHYYDDPSVEEATGTKCIAAWREFWPVSRQEAGRPWYFLVKLSKEHASKSHATLRLQMRALGLFLFLMFAAASLLAWYWLLRLLRSGDTILSENGSPAGKNPASDSTTTDTKHHG
ncbi:protein kinase domain-containing protein [Zavarzinella formosa]|uniref:protein kinase domain-containing protein n=1 Tax=Zavarzinella formosa TaxID=360055 RepID=UPI0002EA86C1|nr:protein kinase [Zavarzinella formosa]